MKNEKDKKKKSFLKKLLKQAKKEIKENPITLTISLITIIATVIISVRQISIEQKSAEFDRLLQTPCLNDTITYHANDVTVSVENVGESTIIIEDIIIKDNGIEKPYKNLFDCVDEELPQKNENGEIVKDKTKLETYKSVDDNEPVSVYIDRSWIRGYETDLIGETRPARDSIILLLFGPSDPNSIDAEEKEHQIRGMRHLLKDYEIEIKYRAIFQDEDDLSSLIITFDTYKDKFIQ